MHGNTSIPCKIEILEASNIPVDAVLFTEKALQSDFCNEAPYDVIEKKKKLITTIL